ncbi:MAG: polysaccharide deacetylase family protein [Candidatus Yanofskybacteria bacterium]|nr:polysaccharide deacetylase family protein [Candidatus Yanofskybacteria bacterium]
MKKWALIFLLLFISWGWSFYITRDTEKPIIKNSGKDINLSTLLKYDPGIEKGICQPDTDKFSKGLVSLTFDDGWKEIYLNAVPILNQSGIKSTQYVSVSELKYNDRYRNYMSVEDVLSMERMGHEIGSHAVNHIRLNKLNEAEIDFQLEKSREELIGMGIKLIDTFAPPYGEYTDYLTAAASKNYIATRMADPGMNDRETDPQLLYGYQMENWMVFDPYMKRLVSRAIKEKKWLIFVFHQVAKPDYRYYTSPEDLISLTNYLTRKGVPIMTVRDVIKQCY